MLIEQANRLTEINEYYFSGKLQQLAAMNSAGHQIINLGIGSPDLQPNPSVTATAEKSLSEKGIHGYQSYQGLPELRKAISMWSTKTYAINLNDEEEIMLLNGSKEGIMHISLAYIGDNDYVLVPNPGYPTYAAATKIAGGKIIYYDVSPDHGICLNQIQDIMGKFNIKAMWINFPHMPTGVMAQPEVLQSLVELAIKNTILLIHDNPYSTILTEKPISIFQIPGAKKVCLELNSLSKSHNMAGWRIGWIAGNAQLIAPVIKVKSNTDSGIFLPIQKAAAAALLDNSDYSIQTNLIYTKRRLIAWQILDVLGCTYSRNTAGMFVWGKIPESCENAIDLSEEILNLSKVFITPGSIFGSNGNSYLRISLCCSATLLEEAKQRIIANLNRLSC